MHMLDSQPSRSLSLALAGVAVAVLAAFTQAPKGKPFAPPVRPLPPPPQGFEAVTAPADNPTTPEKAALGYQLFFDTRLSVDGTRSCYSCHVCEKGLTDGKPKAEGALGKKLPRSSPSLWNIGYHTEFYWDGRSASLEKQAVAAMTGANMGANADEVAKLLNGIEDYRKQFQAVFKSDATPDAIGKALAAYERAFLFCGSTPFDKWRNGDQNAVSAAAKRGAELFLGKAGCGTCHSGVLFTDLKYHNVGIGMDAAEPDVGRSKTSNNPKETGAFKTPTLRDIARSAPYFHDGSVATLEEAVDFMLGGGKANPYLDTENLQKKDLTAAERTDLLAFLRSLDCPCDLKEPALPGK